MNPEKRRARAKHEKRLHNLEVAYKQRKKGKRFVLKVIENTIIEETQNAVNSEGKKDNEKHEENVQIGQKNETGI